MITLNKVSFEIKSILKWGGFVVGGLILIWLLYLAGIGIKNTFFPTPPPAPTVGFNKLPAISFPVNKALEQEYNYELDTVTGLFPTFSDRAKVFKITETKPSLLALDNASASLRRLGFIENPIPVSENIYKWNATEDIERSISFDIYTQDFTFTSAFLQNPDIIAGKNLPDENAAIKLAQNFLQNLNDLPTDIDDTKTKTVLYDIDNLNIVPASSISNAKLIQVFFFQNDLDELPVYYSVPDQSTMSVTIDGGNGRHIAEATFSHQYVSEVSETYPIKTADEAFQDLKNGKAYIAAYESDKKDVFIKDVYLAYYMQDTKQQYLMPIIILQGNDGFYAYVSAVKDEWINN